VGGVNEPLVIIYNAKIMLFPVLLAIGIAALATYVGLVLSDRRNRDALFSRYGFRRNRASGAFTPPRSISPEKQGLPPNKPPSSPEYGNVFPPSRRHILSEMPDGALKGSGKSARELGQQEPNYSKRVPSCEIANALELSDHVTATGFTVAEIKRLGDFPDYAALSGIPLPKAYEDFKIETALPRPYRPFRWAYHQTMCEWIP
jgi:hypothetical protein